jgi:hypothetical protein
MAEKEGGGENVLLWQVVGLIFIVLVIGSALERSGYSSEIGRAHV